MPNDKKANRIMWLLDRNKAEHDVLKDMDGNEYICDQDYKRIYLPGELQSNV